MLSTNGIFSQIQETPFENLPVFRRSLRLLPSVMTTKELLIEDEFEENETKEELMENNEPLKTV